MNAQILFIVCFSATLAAIGITLVCAGLMLILKSEDPIEEPYWESDDKARRTESLSKGGI